MQIIIGALMAACLATAAFADRPAPATADRPTLATLLTLTTGQGAPLIYADACCKRCAKGKACGDSCISRTKSCLKGQGCACD